MLDCVEVHRSPEEWRAYWYDFGHSLGVYIRGSSLAACFAGLSHTAQEWSDVREAIHHAEADYADWWDKHYWWVKPGVEVVGDARLKTASARFITALAAHWAEDQATQEVRRTCADLGRNTAFFLTRRLLAGDDYVPDQKWFIGSKVVHVRITLEDA